MRHVERTWVTIRGKMYSVHTSSIIDGKILVHFYSAEEDDLGKRCGLWLYTDEVEYIHGINNDILALIIDYMDSHTKLLYEMAKKTITPQWQIDIEKMEEKDFQNKYGVSKNDFEIPPEDR